MRRVRVGDAVFEASLDLMLSHGDKKWSFTDCTSFVTMREAGANRAFTLDHNLAQAGLEVLPQVWARSR